MHLLIRILTGGVVRGVFTTSGSIVYSLSPDNPPSLTIIVPTAALMNHQNITLQPHALYIRTH